MKEKEYFTEEKNEEDIRKILVSIVELLQLDGLITVEEKIQFVEALKYGQ